MTDLGHSKGYDYEDRGFSSNRKGQVYPTNENTKAIINSKNYRKTLKDK